MTTIRELLARDLTEPIEEVIKLDQQDEATVHNEITEYVATDRIKQQYRQILQAMADAPSDPNEGVGVWVSGFFGSGKSSFAKNLGYVLANRPLLGQPASALFTDQFRKQSPNDKAVQDIADLLGFLTARLKHHVIMFDVQVDRAVRKSTEPIAEIMYTVLLRELDYAPDYDLAALEMELEGEGRLAEFVRVCAEKYGGQVNPATEFDAVPVTLAGVSRDQYAIWRRVRMAGGQNMQRASAVLHTLAPATYPTPDSWAVSRKAISDITIRTLVDRTFELIARRRPGHAVVFVIDEVGQYVARSADKIENLRAVVEHFGQESKNRILARKAPAPVWVIVTSQEKLDEVVAAIDDKRVELAKLQDRFRLRIDMAPADIREVATRRVLAKKPEAEPVLCRLYEQSAALLKTHTRLERTALRNDVTQEEFVQFYPYLPYFIDLSIDIVSGIRLQAGAPRHIGGSNRTIIKQTYEMLVGHRTQMADEPLGALVSLDRIFDLVEGNLGSEKQKDITDIVQRWPGDPWPARTAKAIALLEYVRDLPRSEANLAALLYRRVDDESPLPHVQGAIKLLEQHQFIRHTEYGWKLQTAQEKSWRAERDAHSPTPKEQHDLLEDRLRDIFANPGLSRYRYQNLRNFRVGVSWADRVLTTGDAQVPLVIQVADDAVTYQNDCDAAQTESRDEDQKLFWVFSLNTELDELVAEVYRSRQMVGKYEQLRAQNKITHEESASLAAEKSEVLRLEERLRARLEVAMTQGQGFFRGIARDGAALGKSLADIFKAWFDFAVPDLYPKLAMGARPLQGNEAQDILKAANLTGLPTVFYGPPDGLDLIVKEGNKYTVNPQAPVIQEVYSYLEREHAYGNKVTGRMLEDAFGGVGYGWERDMLWLILATLLRGGAIELTYQGRRYRNHLDPQVRQALGSVNAFRAASFAPRKSLDLPTLVKAVQQFEQLTGDEVDVEESAIAQEFQRFARAELDALLPVEATVRAHQITALPEVLREYREALETVLHSASDACVSILAGEGASLQALRNRVQTIRKGVDAKGLAYLRRMRAAVHERWPALQSEAHNGALETHVHTLQQALAAGDFYAPSAERDTALRQIEETFAELYRARHAERARAFAHAIDDIRAQPDWAQVPTDVQASLLKPLTDRACAQLSLSPDELVCQRCHTGLAALASDLAAVDTLRDQVLWRLQELLTPPEQKIARVRFADVVGVGRTLNSQEEIEAVLGELRDFLLKLVTSGTKAVLE